MASLWDYFWPKFWLSVIDKAVLGPTIVVVAYWLQKRPDIFKRYQALASELAKARIPAYHRVFPNQPHDPCLLFYGMMIERK